MAMVCAGKAFMESLIKDLSDGANGVIEDNTHHISYQNWDAKDLVAFVIKSSYKIGRNETIEKFRALTELYIDYLDRKKKNRKIKEYDKSQLELRREKTSDECECILKKLLHMTEEEFELRKERLFEFGYSHYFFF